ncbi:M23 family metallopeptidase [Exiguobacterium sp. s21]|uniref:M23 family metallopeptidase n=1 Tax=Exiguobacterium sp. s21 TaxID=2751244 RepID=UPI001BE55348|nr:M23 family metallopeptidase [Exiguobacterium sp. s21]
MSASVYYYHRKKKMRYELTPVVTRVDITGSVDRYYRSASIVIADKQSVPYDTGERVRVFSDQRLLFDGRVFRVEDTDRGVTLTCHDNAYYLLKNMAQVSYTRNNVDKANQSATLARIFTDLCRKKRIKYGYVAKTKHIFKDVQFFGQDIQTILQTLIGMERRATGRSYYIRAVGESLELRERGALSGVIIDTDTTFSLRATRNAEDLYTSLRIQGTETREIMSEDKAPTNARGINSANYDGVDGTEYQSGFRARLKNCDRWDSLITEVANAKKVDPLLMKIIVMLESSGNPDAISSDGAGSLGLTQITPGNVGIYVNPARLRDPKYNLEMFAEILLGPKQAVAKRLGRKPSVVNMAHFWNGWPVSHGEGDGPYGSTVRTIYAGFGGDPDKLFTDTSGSGSAKEQPETKQTYTYQRGDTVSNPALVSKVGLMTKTVTVNYTDEADFKRQVKALQASIREDRSAVVSLVGHSVGVAGRKVQFNRNTVTNGTWYIRDDSHQLSASGHIMTLTLSLYDETPEPEYVPPKELAETVKPKPDAKTFIQPALGRVSQGYGAASGAYGYTFHNGIDIAAPVGTPIKAAASGKVVLTRSTGAYGNRIMLQHSINGQTWHTNYAHLSSIGVKVGQTVTQGQTIGKMGSTGNSTGSHLHFEIHRGAYVYSGSQPANTVNPRNYF